MSLDLIETTAIVTVSYNSSGQLEQFLSSLKTSGYGNIAVTIADNSSHDLDSTQAIAASYGANVISLQSNLGYGGGINAAVTSLPKSKSYVVICNPDILICEQAIDVLLAKLASDQRIGAIGPAIKNLDGSTYPSARHLPSLLNGIGHALFARIWPANPWTASYHAENSPEARDAGWLSGACLLVRREAFEAVGGFDERYFMYFEDVDLGHRFAQAGYRNYYEPGASVIHFGGLSTAQENTKMVSEHHRSAYLFLASKYSGPVLAPVRWSLRLGLRVRAWSLTHRKHSKSTGN